MHSGLIKLLGLRRLLSHASILVQPHLKRGISVLAQAGFGRADLRHVKIATPQHVSFLIFNAPISP